MAVLNDKAALQEWEKYRISIRDSTPVDLTETAQAQRKRISELEDDPDAWKKYYLPHDFSSDAPAFHNRASRRLIKKFLEKKHWFEVRNWARGLAKTTLTRGDVLYLVLTGKLKFVLYISATYDAAETFLTKFQVELDSNQRIIKDYGKQMLPGSWAAGDFTTRKGVKFMALGARQSPRGQANRSFRPDCIIYDDFDTDEECRNPDIVNQKWDWCEKAVMFAVDVARPYLIIWLGNIISEDCCVVRAGQRADHQETVNIRDENGKSIWPQKNSEPDIDYLLSKVSWEAGQQEYFNNPIRQGQTFKEIHWGPCPPLESLDFVISYSDPGTSNKDKPTLKSKAQNSCKGTGLVGAKDNKFYLYTCVLDNMTNAHFIEGMYHVRGFVNDKTSLYSFVENNSLQDPFYEQILLPLIYEYGKENGGVLGITPDTDRKGEKWFRIEADLEPQFRLGNFIFNEEEKSNPHMQRMAAQFLAASPNSKFLDGPDLVQGAVKKIQQKRAVQTVGGIDIIPRMRNSKKW